MIALLSLLLAGSLGLMLIVKICLLVLGIRRNQMVGQQLRDQLWGKVEQLPLRRMLDSRRLDARTFLNEQRVVEIERQLRTCAGCEETPRCRALARTAADWTFCPLEDDISRLTLRV